MNQNSINWISNHRWDWKHLKKWKCAPVQVKKKEKKKDKKLLSFSSCWVCGNHSVRYNMWCSHLAAPAVCWLRVSSGGLWMPNLLFPDEKTFFSCDHAEKKRSLPKRAANRCCLVWNTEVWLQRKSLHAFTSELMTSDSFVHLLVRLDGTNWYNEVVTGGKLLMQFVESKQQPNFSALSLIWGYFKSILNWF